MEMRFLITWGISEPPAGSGIAQRGCHAEVLQSGPGLRVWAAGRPSGSGHEFQPSKSSSSCIQLGLQGADARKGLL